MKTLEGKVVVLGAQGVGKTSMIVRYAGKVWDTAGQERFRSMVPMYYRNANAAMLVFDLTQYNTFAAVKRWVSELRRHIEEPMVLVVIGNKSDLGQDRQVDAEEGRIYATQIGATYHETSVVQGEGIENVFLAIGIGLFRLSSIEHDSTSIKVYESTNSSLSDADMSLTPSHEESPQNLSIAHGIQEKPHTCC